VDVMGYQTSGENIDQPHGMVMLSEDALRSSAHPTQAEKA